MYRRHFSPYFSIYFIEILFYQYLHFYHAIRDDFYINILARALFIGQATPENKILPNNARHHAIARITLRSHTGKRHNYRLFILGTITR